MKSDFVSLHPYFKAHPGKLEEVKAGFPKFAEATASEKECLFYGFTVNGDEILCREAYESVGGVLDHLDNVGELLGKLLKIANLTRLEIHGPPTELEKLKEPLAHLNPAWFTLETDVKE